MDKTFLQKLLEHPGIINILAGVIVLLVGAAGGIRTNSFSIQLPDTAGRAVAVVIGVGLIVHGIWWETGRKENRVGKKAIEAVSLLGRKEVYREAKRLIKKCKGDEVIRATSFGQYMEGGESDEKLPEFDSYLETLAVKVGEAKRKRLDMVYKVVIGFRYTSEGVPPPHKQRGIRKRKRTFSKRGALDRLRIRSIDTTWSIDVLIVGDEDMIIGFPTITGSGEITLGVRLTGRDFVRKAARWFDDFVWQAAQPVTWTGEEG